MSSTNAIVDEGSVSEQRTERWSDFEVVDEEAERERNLRPTVSMEIVARIDVEADPYRGLTLAEEERVRAREWELERTRSRYDRRQDSGREVRTRDYVAARTPSRTWQAWTSDPREELSRDDLAVVNQQAQRLAGRTRGYSRAAISRMLGERVRRGQDVVDAVIEVSEALTYGAGQIVPIGALERFEADDEVSVEGVVVRLFEPRHPAIAQVGLLEDETGTTKLTVWERSNQPVVRLGERVRVRGGALGFYRERPCIAATGWSELVFPERGRWWER
ncbi:DNA-binding protein (plasmid) [Halarchaeum sp. CBA1220]|uniref:DNA-binding protein n=1 Tax=Halarchaeum sp. CBA1220 TaxID=1853682 RepID=UPI000F3A84CE|nr:DNA-binding protein [Halarchaeum sp. CBA1220]QLC35086.1 DNA-binding protein [Halarchaeum sp. CBA1220]